MNEVQIAGRCIGPGHPTYIVAEMSGNHNQDFDKAVEIIGAAKEAGADAIKLQTYTADTITIESDAEFFQVKGGTLWDGTTLHALYQQAYTRWDWHPRLQEVAQRLQIDLFSTPFDRTAVDFLEGLRMPAYKVASPELMDHPLLECIAATGRPIIMSTGMANIAEIDEAVRVIRTTNPTTGIVLLKCTAAYPAPIDEINLRAMPSLGFIFHVPFGLSDHTMGGDVAVAAVAMGATVIEKHLTISRQAGGPDAAFSMEPAEFRQMVNAIRRVESAMGHDVLGPSPREVFPRSYRRSLFVAEDLQPGDVLTDKNIRSVRPGQGLHTKYLKDVLGRKVRSAITKGTPLQWNFIE